MVIAGLRIVRPLENSYQIFFGLIFGVYRVLNKQAVEIIEIRLERRVLACRLWASLTVGSALKTVSVTLASLVFVISEGWLLDVRLNIAGNRIIRGLSELVLFANWGLASSLRSMAICNRALLTYLLVPCRTSISVCTSLFLFAFHASSTVRRLWNNHEEVVWLNEPWSRGLHCHLRVPLRW